MAWRSQKSAWRKRLNGRWLRWKLWRGLFLAAPPLARRYSFPLRGASALESASRILDNTVRTEGDLFTPDQWEQVVRRSIVNDKVRAGHSAGIDTTKRQVAIVPDCTVLGHLGIVTRRDGAMLSAGAGWKPNWNYAKPKLLKTRPFRDGLVTSLQDTHHYYHFFERLLGLIGYLDREHEAGAPFTVLVRSGGPAFQQAVCKAVEAAYPGVSFASLEQTERAEVAHYLWLHELSDNTEWLPVDAARAARLSALLRAYYRQPEPAGGELLFFSRGNAKARRLTNEAELEAIAARRGFQRFEAVSGNHPDQVRRFGNADVIVAVHGAGLTNLLFARPGAAVVELFPEDCVKSTYLFLSNRLNLRHSALLGSRGDYHQAFHVDPELFAARLDGILAGLAKDKSTAA